MSSVRHTLRALLVAGLLAALTAPAGAVTQLVGDVDGFGVDPTGLVRATGAPHTSPADTDGDGIIEPGEYLPDWNKNGSTAVNSGDSFDFRSAAEIAATDGAQWTDYAVQPAGAAHGAQFVFTFVVPAFGEIDYGVDHFINFVFGDYDVVPASIAVDGVVVGLTTQGGGNDGLVQAAYAAVPWAAMTDGAVVIEVIAPNEPYLAFDYALLDTDEFADRDDDGVPDQLDNCPDDWNTAQLDSDGDGLGDVCDPCPSDPGNTDSDGDGLCDADDECPADPDNDADGDGVCGNVDACAGTVLPEDVPTERLGTNRFADVDGDGVFDTTAPSGKGPGRAYTIEQTAGCSCRQIIDALDLGAGHEKFGCSISAMDEWLLLMADPGVIEE